MKDFAPALLAWYDTNKRDLPFRQDKDPYKIWISEIMAQQTRIAAMTAYFQRFLDLFPDLPSLAAASDDQLKKAWQGLGYYSRARNLKKAASLCMERHSGKLPAAYEQLLTLPGIGPYTAGAIGAIAYGLPVPAVDGNVCRVYARLYGLHCDILSPAGKKEITALYEKTMLAPYGDFVQAVMELGALVCTPKNPDCTNCPIASWCTQDTSLPVKKPKKARKTEQKKFLIQTDGKGISLVRRPDTGLLAGLYGFEEVAAFPPDALILTSHTHVFTHIQWNMEGAIQFVPENPDLISLDQAETLAIPSAFQPFYQQTKEIIYARNHH